MSALPPKATEGVCPLYKLGTENSAQKIWSTGPRPFVTSHEGVPGGLILKTYWGTCGWTRIVECQHQKNDCFVRGLLARRKGFEPLTPRFEVWCSIQLS